jgi:hypothetical protein
VYRARHGLGGVALFAAAGLGAAELFPGLRALPFTRRLGYAYLLGIAIVAGSLWALSHGLGVPLRRPAIFITAAVPILAGLAARLLNKNDARRAAPKLREPWGWGALFRAAVAAALALVCLGLFAEAVANPVTNWDSRMTWSAQAIYLRAEGTVDAAVLRRPQWYVDHPRYPILLPLAQVIVQEGFGAADDRELYRPLYAALFPAFLLVLRDAARQWAGKTPAALACLAAASLPALTFWTAGGAASSYSDLPLGCFFAAGLLLLLRCRRRIADGLAAGLLLGAAVLTKNEGIFLALSGLALAALSLFLKRRRPGWRRLARLGAAAVPVLLALVLLTSWRSAIPNRHDEGYAGFVDPGDFWPEAVTRIPLLAPAIAREMSSREVWTFFWWLVPAVLLTGWRGWRGRRRAVSMPLLLAAASPPAVAWGAYTVYTNPLYLVPVTWNRFLVQASLPLLLLLALSLRGLLRNGRSALLHHPELDAGPRREAAEEGPWSRLEEGAAAEDAGEDRHGVADPVPDVTRG